ncbi:unnamed protein product [Lymnaea stagnalis]|uniref:Uncharacterized protein n=1 Tax=Lymnaea stagnalis TaxID=6523 RepID=A0AAV2H379_LYMST
MEAIFYVSLVFLACTHPPVTSGTPIDSTTETSLQQHVDQLVNELTSTNEREILAFLEKLDALNPGSDGQVEAVNDPLRNDTVSASDKDILDFINKLDSMNGETTGSSIQPTSKQPPNDPSSESTDQDILGFLEKLDKLNSETGNDTNIDPIHNVTSTGSDEQDILNFIKKLDETNSELSQAPVESNTADQFDGSPTTRSSQSGPTDDGATVLPRVDHSKVVETSSSGNLDTAATDAATSSTAFGPEDEFSNDQVVSSPPPFTPAKVAVVSTSYYTPVLIAICVLAVLIVLVTAALMWKCSNRRRKDMSLNKDFNRWDPQLLRPTKADMDAFMFGSPLPSVSEMIKQSATGVSMRDGGSVTGREYDAHLQI